MLLHMHPEKPMFGVQSSGTGRVRTSATDIGLVSQYPEIAEALLKTN